MSFKPGDVVRLKSGGPIMTIDGNAVERAGDVPYIRVVWFDGKGEKHYAAFSVDSLIVVTV